MNIQNIAKEIKLVIFDVDGVFTDGKIYFTHRGEQAVAFHVHDGQGIKLLQNSCIEVAIISGRNTKAVQHRLDELGIQHVFLGQEDKTIAFDLLLAELDIMPKHIAYVGDDLPDKPLMEKVGLPIAVANAVESIKCIAKYCTQKKGGYGAVREVCDLICSAKQA